MILCAAIKFHIDKTDKDIVIAGRRHYQILNMFADLGYKPFEGYHKIADGFLTTDNEFLTRQEAYSHAMACGQLSNTVRRNSAGCELFSEDLY